MVIYRLWNVSFKGNNRILTFPEFPAIYIKNNIGSLCDSQNQLLSVLSVYVKCTKQISAYFGRLVFNFISVIEIMVFNWKFKLKP